MRFPVFTVRVVHIDDRIVYSALAHGGGSARCLGLEWVKQVRRDVHVIVPGLSS